MIDPGKDALHRPFKIDGTLTPPARSPLAALNVEADEIEKIGADRALAEAQRAFDEDPDLATVYGRRITREELKDAAAILADAEGRVIAQLIDYKNQTVDLGDLSELQVALDQHARSFLTTPDLENLDLVARLLEVVVDEPKLPAAPPTTTAPPDAPKLNDVLDSLL